MSSTDVIVIGAGHNGLVAAAYLARAGKRVTVVEQRDRVGGTCATDEIAPGYRAPAVFGTVERLHRSVVSELDLESHGLQLLSGGGTLLLQPEDAPMAVPANGLPAGLSKSDAVGLQRLVEFLGRVTRAMEPVLAEPLPDIDTRSVGDLLELFSLGWRLRKLGRKEMPAAMRMLPMALRDVAEEYVADERLKAALAWPGLRASSHGPYAPGGAFSLLYHCPPWHGGPFAAPVYASGGPGALTAALAASAAAAGAQVRVDTRVEHITVKDDEITGVVLEGGEEISAPCVLSAVDPRATLTRLLQPGWLDPDVLAAVGNIRAHGTVSIVTMALDTLPRFKLPEGGERALSGRMQLGPTLRYQEEAADAVKYGRLPEHPVIEITIPSTVDRSLAPEGKHVLHAWVQYTPRHLRDTTWEHERDRLGKLVLDTIDQHAVGFSSSVAHMQVTTPADIESRFGITDGHPYHVETTLDQVLYMRPFPGWYDYRSPVAGLYLGGPGCHPGGGITGLPGKLAARRVLHDWKAQRIA